MKTGTNAWMSPPVARELLSPLANDCRLRCPVQIAEEAAVVRCSHPLADFGDKSHKVISPA